MPIKTNKTETAIRKLIKKNPNPKLVKDAFEFAKESYREKNRLSGENYIFHASRIALHLDRMGLDPVTIAFAFLHDVLDDLPYSAKKVEAEAIEKKFGREIKGLVEKISDLSKIRFSLSVGIKEKKIFAKEKIENLRKMFLALSEDLRVVLVELVSRLDGLNFLHYLSKDQQILYSLETLHVFVPIANRMGLSEIKRKLEDSAFAYLYPDRFKWLKKNIKEQYSERARYLKKFILNVQKILTEGGAKFISVDYRAKSYWSTYKKLIKHNMNFAEIHDLLALRIITPDIENCYRAIGIIHNHFKPISEEIKDYIARPKTNGYRSLHTTVFSNDDKITEIQIRTEEMNKEAEYGICAHWAYKEKINLKKDAQAAKWAENVPNFWKTFKINFFSNQVFAFTPKGDIIVLPKNSTPIDFAYAVHSDIGNHCESAKIDGKIVPLSYTLKNGDVVQIDINKNKRPSEDWLKLVKTSLAKGHIKKLTGQDKSGFKFPIPGFIKRKFSEISEASKKRKREKELLRKQAKHIYLAGQKGMLVHIAKCCNPQPGDSVRAYLAQNRATVLHKSSCSILKKISEKMPEKIVDASWK